MNRRINQVRYEQTRKGKECRRRYESSPRGRFLNHKRKAKRRGIEFLLTFDQWLAIWTESGHFSERGNSDGDCYVMARDGDQGPYAVGNVSIVSHSANVADRNRNYAAAMRAGIDWDWYKKQPRDDAYSEFPDPTVPF